MPHQKTNQTMSHGVVSLPRHLTKVWHTAFPVYLRKCKSQGTKIIRHTQGSHENFWAHAEQCGGRACTGEDWLNRFGRGCTSMYSLIQPLQISKYMWFIHYTGRCDVGKEHTHFDMGIYRPQCTLPVGENTPIQPHVWTTKQNCGAQRLESNYHSTR